MANHHALKSNVTDSSEYSLKERQQLTSMIIKMFRLWGLPSKQQLSLLGLSQSSRYMLQRYLKKESCIPSEQDKIIRAELLLLIYKYLKDLFPENKLLREDWVNRKNAVLDNKSPIDVMTENGLLGIAKITRFLEYQLVS